MTITAGKKRVKAFTKLNLSVIVFYWDWLQHKNFVNAQVDARGDQGGGGEDAGGGGGG